VSRWLWAIAIVASLVVAFAADRVIWPDRTVFALYAIPVVIASQRWPLWAVLSALVGSIVLAIYDLFLSKHTTADDTLGLIALLVVGLMATLHTLHRQELQQKIRRQEEIITTVAELRQPLAVILGYTQLIVTRPNCEVSLSQALNAIRRAAVHLCEMLDEIMIRCGTR
jgi:signal transduction histidine kinase